MSVLFCFLVDVTYWEALIAKKCDCPAPFGIFIFQYWNCKMYVSSLKESFEFSLCNVQTFHREKNTSINFFYEEYMQQTFGV